MQVLLPPGWPRPKGYSNGVAASGRMVFIAGMVGWDSEGRFHSDDIVEQTRQALSANPEAHYTLEELSIVEAYHELPADIRERLVREGRVVEP
mgnify:CR=1 FL=1